VFIQVTIIVYLLPVEQHEQEEEAFRGVSGRIILKRILEEIGFEIVCTGCGPVACSCEQGSEPSGCMQGNKFFE
jgi:hypothetical protein